MQLKTCTSTPKTEGCGKTKPVSEFQKIRKHLENYDGVCKECRNRARRKNKNIVITPEIFNQYDELMRGI